MEYGVWSMEYGVWSMEYGVWSMEYGASINLQGHKIPPKKIEEKQKSFK